MEQTKRLDKKICWIIGAICVPIIGILLYLWKNKMTIGMVYLPMSDWNDELSYYKQIQGMIAYGTPQGYFGYDESTAAIGTFGPWSPVLLFPYFIFGKLFGWDYWTPIATNIFLWIITALGYVYLIRPNLKQFIWVAVAFLAHATALRYIFSVTPESIVMVLVAWFFILLLASKQYEKYAKLSWILTNSVMVLLILMRGYYALLGIVLIFCLVKNKCRAITIILQTGVILAAALLYVIILGKFTSPYFSALVDTRWISEIFINPISGIRGLGIMLQSASIQTFSYMKSAVLTHDTVGSWYIIFFCVGAWLIYRSVCKNSQFWMGFIIWICMLLALWLLYDVRVGSRHLLAWGLLGVLLITSVEKNRVIKLLLVISLVYLTWGSKDTYSYSLPRYDSNFASSLLDNEKKLEEEMPIHEDPWDNTIIWALSVNYKDLYAVPEGYGINICHDQYIIDNASELKSKYVAASIASDLDSYADDMGWKEVALCNTTRIWQVR